VAMRPSPSAKARPVRCGGTGRPPRSRNPRWQSARVCPDLLAITHAVHVHHGYQKRTPYGRAANLISCPSAVATQCWLPLTPPSFPGLSFLLSIARRHESAPRGVVANGLIRFMIRIPRICPSDS